MVYDMLREVCALITARLIAQIKDVLHCSDLEAAERFKFALTDLFPADAPPPSPPPPPKRKRKSHRHLIRMNRDDFPPDLIKQHFFQRDGKVYRRVAAAGKPIGSETGSTPTRTHASVVLFGGYRFPRSHIIFVLWHGRWPRRAIFHRNFDRGDDRIENIAEATHSEICTSACVTKRNRFGVKGVAWPQRKAKDGTDRFGATIQRHGIARRLGTFQTPSEAHQAYCAAAADLHGSFNPAARLYRDDT